MSEEKKQSESVDTGSLDKTVDPNNLGGDSGQSTKKEPSGNGETKTKEETVPKSMYDSLESKLGTQGEELGKYRDFFTDVKPLMEKLDANPELFNAIMEDKIDSKLVQAAIEGKVSIKEAEQVTKAHEDVKKDMGEKKYEQASVEEIENRISRKLDEKTGEIEKKFSKELSEDREIRDYETKITSFINKTSDFSDFADAIKKFSDSHPDISDIEVMYKAVKADKLIAEAEQKNKDDVKEKEKELASNVSGGSSHSKSVIKDNDLVDRMFGGIKDPNSF